MNIRHLILASVLVCAGSVAQAEGQPNGTATGNPSGMQNGSMGGNTTNSGPSDARDTANRMNNPSPTTGANTTNSGRAAPDEQDTSKGKGPSTATPPVGSR